MEPGASPVTSNIQASFGKTRLAPTPSGYLHPGNVYSFALTTALAHRYGAKLLLRIDDLDRQRFRTEYLVDIFESLRFMDIAWDEGPAHVAEFESRFSQTLRRSLYGNALDRLREKDLVYACECSRNRFPGDGHCACFSKKIHLDKGGTSWRLKTVAGTPVTMRTLGGETTSVFPAKMTGFVVRKKDGEAAYQLSSLMDDEYFGIDLVVRGEDLYQSSLAQLYLAPLLDCEGFKDAVFVHHQLLTAPGGQKLSKSEGATSLRYLRGQGLGPEEIYQLVGKMAGIKNLRHWRDLGVSLV